MLKKGGSTLFCLLLKELSLEDLGDDFSRKISALREEGRSAVGAQPSMLGPGFRFVD